MRAILLGALALAACGGDAGGLLVVTVDASRPVPAVASFRVVATNAGQTAMAISVPVAHGPTDIPPAQTFALGFDSGRSGAVHVVVNALGSDGSTIASGSGDGTITPGQETTATVTLGGVVVGDMGGDAATDGAITDGAPADATSLADLGVPPDLASCGACSPGEQRTVACGNCGTETDTCTTSCQWSPGACTGAGPCSPGATQPGACDPCSQQTCDGNCQWAACALKPGNACEFQNGKGFRGCTHACSPPAGFGACTSPAIDVCQSNCQWAAVCECVASGSVGYAECD